MDTATISAWGSKLIDICTSLGIKIVLALLILIIGRIVIKKLLKGVGKIKGMDKVDPAVRSFLMNFFKIALSIVLAISIISVQEATELVIPAARARRCRSQMLPSRKAWGVWVRLSRSLG